MIGIVILWCVALVLLINLKVSSVNKLLWALIVTFVPLFGSIVFLVWRKRFLKQRLLNKAFSADVPLEVYAGIEEEFFAKR